MTWYVIIPDEGLRLVGTKETAEKLANEELARLREEATDEQWHPDIEDLEWGKCTFTPHEAARRVDVKVDENGEETCDYVLGAPRP